MHYIHPITDQSIEEWMKSNFLTTPLRKKKYQELIYKDVIFINGQWEVFQHGKSTRTIENRHGSYISSFNSGMREGDIFLYAGNYDEIQLSFKNSYS